MKNTFENVPSGMLPEKHLEKANTCNKQEIIDNVCIVTTPVMVKVPSRLKQPKTVNPTKKL